MALVTSTQAPLVGGSDQSVIPGTGATGLIILGMLVPGDNAGTSSMTWAAGFTQLTTTAFNNGGGRGFPCSLYLASGTTVAASYTCTVPGAGGTTPIGMMACWSGRNLSTPTNVINTNNGNGSTSPVSIASTGGTALSGDDAAVFAVVNNTALVSAWTFTAPAGYTSQQSSGSALLASPGGALNLSTKDALSAGATGILTTVATNAANNADFIGVVISLPSSGGTPSIAWIT